MEIFWANIDFYRTVSRKNTGLVLDMIERLEEGEDITALIRLLVFDDKSRYVDRIVK
jgi:hypothetical protein